VAVRNDRSDPRPRAVRRRARCGDAPAPRTRISNASTGTLPHSRRRLRARGARPVAPAERRPGGRRASPRGSAAAGHGGRGVRRAGERAVPGARRVLLTAYADAEAAIRALKTVRIDHYLLQPWQPAEQNLYPVLDDLLVDWEDAVRRAFEGVRVVGYRFSPRSHETRDFLVRNCVPFQWLDLERDEEARRLVAAAGVKAVAAAARPVSRRHPARATDQRGDRRTDGVTGSPAWDVLRPRDRRGRRPDWPPPCTARARLAHRDGRATRPGRASGSTSMIENYLGFPPGSRSGSRAPRRRAGQEVRGRDRDAPVMVGLRVDGSSRVAILNDGSELRCQVMLLATGASGAAWTCPASSG